MRKIFFLNLLEPDSLFQRKTGMYHRYYKYIFLLCFIAASIVFVPGCADRNKWARQVEWKDIDGMEIPGQEDFAEEGAIILLDEGRMQIFSTGPTGFSEFERHKIIKVFNLKGERFANIVVPYYPRVSINGIQARTISPSGKITVLDEEDIYDVNLYPGFVFYSDQRAKIFTMPAIEPGSIIEYRYKVSITGQTLWHSWVFQDEIPTLLSRFTLIHPAEWKLNYRQYNLGIEPEIYEAPQGFKASLLWEVKNIPGLKSEYGMPPRKELVSRLSFAPVWVETWGDVSRWYDELAAPQTEQNDEIRELSRKLTAGASSDREKLKNIFEWVRDNVRYIAVEIGIGGYQPHPAAEILHNQYGDCKDMTTLLCALAEASEIAVDEVLISTRPNGFPDTTLPSPFQFNHAIAYCPSVGEEGIWMDATQKGTPFGKIPWYNQGLPVLQVSQQGEGELRMTPEYPADSNQVQISWNIHLRSDGSANVTGETRFRGALAEEVREDFFYVTHDLQRQWLETYLAKRCAGIKLDTFQISGLQPVVDPLEITYEFQTSAFARSRPGQLVIQPGEISAFTLPDMFRNSRRIHPVQLKFPMKQQIDLTIRLPENYHPEEAVFKDSVETAYGKMSMEWMNKNNRLHLGSSYILSKSRISPEEYSDFRIFLNRIQEKDRKEVILIERSGNRATLSFE